MSSNYTGVPTATQSPSPAPGLYVAPILNLPTDGDALNVSSVLQPFKAVADWAAWASTMFAAIKGVTEWVNTVTYPAGSVVVRPFASVDAHIYLALQNNANSDPATTPAAWKRIDWGSTDIAAKGGVLVTGTHSTGIVCSHGATCSGAYMLKFASDTMRMITFPVVGISNGTYTDVDLNGCDETFASAVVSGTCSPTSGSMTVVPQCWLNLNIGGDRNVVRVYAVYSQLDSGGGSYPLLMDVSVTLWGA